MKRFLAAHSFAILAVASCALQPQGIDDGQFSLSKGSVFETATPRPFELVDDAKTTRPLEGSGMPVMISHTIENDLPITASKNGCLECHTTTGRKVKGSPPVPSSHVVGPGSAKPTLVGRRYVCTTCHAPQTDVMPLVANTSQ